jgi:hypothetical protein
LLGVFLEEVACFWIFKRMVNKENGKFKNIEIILETAFVYLRQGSRIRVGWSSWRA